MRPLHIGIEKATEKIKYYCGYQERCQQEVRDKLYSFGLYQEEVEELISRMIQEDYLNEERFAIAFAGGRFRMKNWGRRKIEQALFRKKISPYCIKKALKNIPEEDYDEQLDKLATKKLAVVSSEKNKWIKWAKVRNYLLQKGYEAQAIKLWLDKNA